MLNSENKSKSLRSNKLLCFKYFSKLRHFSFKSTQPNYFSFLIVDKTTKNIFKYFKLFKPILECGNCFIYNI